MKNLKFKQTVRERKMNMSTLDNLIKDTVDELNISSMTAKFESYLIDISKTDNKHKDYHLQLISLVSSDKAMRTALRVIIKEAVTNKSYIERNVVASKIGKKLFPKKLVTSSPFNRASICLTLGLNIINIISTMNIIKYRMITLENKHNVSTIIPNESLILPKMKELFLNIRASSYMVYKPLPHTATTEGGYLTEPKTMLNSSGFSSIKSQPTLANIAINKLQEIPYSIRSNFTTEYIEEYKSHDRWYDSNGRFLVTEWSKFVHDLRLAIDIGKIYFPMKYDDRGRIYDTSNYIKLQGDSYQKAMLEFSNKEVCTKEGLDELKVCLCNEIYSDKITFKEAKEYINSKSIEELENIANSTDNIKAKLLYQDYLDALEGKPIGTIAYYDCTNSGLQMYSLLGKDSTTAKLCNINYTETLADAYQELADRLNTETNTENFHRSNVKKSFMTFLYGAMKEQILNKSDEAIGHLFPSDMHDDTKWDIFQKVMSDMTPSAISLMNLIYSYNVQDKTKFRWVMPDGFNVELTSTKSYTGDDSIKGWFIDHTGKTHEGTTSVVLEEYDEYSRSLSPNLIHATDSYFLRQIISRCTFDVAAIHDAFGVHPNYASKLRSITREVAYDIAKSNLLIDILSQIDPHQTIRNLRNNRIYQGNMDPEDVLKSKYILR